MTYRLRYVETGAVVKMANGRPFQYTSHALALIGRRVLAKHLKQALKLEEI